MRRRMCDLIKNWLEKNTTRLISFGWFIFIIIIFGQLGPALAILHSLWQGHGVSASINAQAINGNFIVFSTAMLASSSYFMVREYIKHKEIGNRKIKSSLLLMTAITILLGVFIAFELTQKPAFVYERNVIFHWLVYAFSILLSITLWIVEEDESADAVIKDLSNNSKRMTEDSNNNTSTNNGVKI